MNEEIPFNPPGLTEYIREGARKNAALLRKMQGKPEAVETAKAQGQFAPCPGCAALLEIIKTCEEYQNADFEGKELEHQCDEGYRCSMKVITIASAALQEHEAQHNTKLSV
jgi:hypothetical protein